MREINFPKAEKRRGDLLTLRQESVKSPRRSSCLDKSDFRDGWIKKKIIHLIQCPAGGERSKKKQLKVYATVVSIVNIRHDCECGLNV